MRGRKPNYPTIAMGSGDNHRAPLKIPKPPAGLKGEAAAEWRRITRLLSQLGIVANLDRAALAVYCVAWARWTDAEAHLAEQGAVVKSPSGYPIANPYLSVSNQAAKQIQSLLSEFGLSPAARHRLLKSTKPVLKPDPLDPVLKVLSR